MTQLQDSLTNLGKEIAGRPGAVSSRDLPDQSTGVHKVDEAITRYRQLEDDRRGAVRELRELEDGRLAAVKLDRRELAETLRSGAADPGRKKLDAHDARIVAARRRREAIDLAVTGEAEALVAVLREHTEPLVAYATDQHTQARAHELAAMAEFRAVAERRTQARALAGWALGLRSGSVRFRGRAARKVAELTQPNGNPYDFLALVTALEASAAETAETSPAA
jgi:hypothetical protein